MYLLLYRFLHERQKFNVLALMFEKKKRKEKDLTFLTYSLLKWRLIHNTLTTLSARGGGDVCVWGGGGGGGGYFKIFMTWVCGTNLEYHPLILIKAKPRKPYLFI